MSWIELKLNFPQERLEDIAAYLFALGCEGINVTDTDIIIYFSVRKWTGEVRTGMIEYLRHFDPAFSSRNIRVTAIADHDWMSDWKKNFRAIRIGQRTIIKPPWEKYRIREGEVVVTINPKMAFGTGHHESTQLMISEMEKTVKPGMDVLDIGTGSGILAILAARLQAQNVLAIDHDVEAVRNAQENAQLNKIGGNLIIALGDPSELPDKKYDLVLANINRNVLTAYAGLFAGFLKPDGVLILSGLLLSDETAVLPVYQDAGFRLIRKSAVREWMAMVMRPEWKRTDEEPGRNRYRNELDTASDRPVE